MAKTWKELKAEGVKRCCAMLVDRKTGTTHQCRRRAEDQTKVGFCSKHRPYIEREITKHLKVIKLMPST